MAKQMARCPAECSATEAHGKSCFQEKGVVRGVTLKARTAFDGLGRSSFRRVENRSQAVKG